jgi:hypothetical protein
MHYKISEAKEIPVTLPAMRACLAEGYPIIFGLKLTKKFFNPGPSGFIDTPNPDDPQSAEHGLHAMLIVGYSDLEERCVSPVTIFICMPALIKMLLATDLSSAIVGVPTGLIKATATYPTRMLRMKSLTFWASTPYTDSQTRTSHLSLFQTPPPCQKGVCRRFMRPMLIGGCDSGVWVQCHVLSLPHCHTPLPLTTAAAAAAAAAA